MALYERITGNFYDKNGREYVIRIFKDAATFPGTRSFELGGEGFIHEYYGDKEELWDFIKYGKVTVPLIVQDSTDKSVLDELLEGNEEEWYLRINGSAGTDISFQGIVLIDQSTYQNTSFPYEVNVVASDGLSLLQNKRIELSAGSFKSQPFNVWFLNLLNQFRFGSFGTFELWTSFRLFNDLMLTYDNSSVNRDPLVQMYVNPKDFVYSDKQNGRNFETCGEVLKQLCEFLHCNLFYSDGKYWLIGLNERNNPALEVFKYTGNYTMDVFSPIHYDGSGTSTSYDGSTSHTYDLSSNSVEPQGGLFRTKPAAARVRELNSAEGSFMSGALYNGLLSTNDYLPIDSSTSGSANVPDIKMVQVADVRPGIEEIVLKGDVIWKVKEREPLDSQPSLSSVNWNLQWSLRLFFIQRDSTAFTVTYSADNVYKGSTDEWTTGSDAYLEIDLGNINGEQNSIQPYADGFLHAELTTDNVTSISVYNWSGFGLTINSTGWIRVRDNASAWRYLHYSAVNGNGFMNTLVTFTIDTTDGSEDFASVNANVDNDVEVIQELSTLYRTEFEASVKSFTNNDNLYVNMAMVGKDNAGNTKVYLEDKYEYGTRPSGAPFDVYYQRMDTQVFANQDVQDITNFEFITDNSNNSTYSYEIILPENKILEKSAGDDYYGNDTNWLKVFPTDETTGRLYLSNPQPAQEFWGESESGGNTRLLRSYNHQKLLAMTAEPYLSLETSLDADLSFYQRIGWDSKVWIISSGVFYANRATWDVVLIQLQTNSSSGASTWRNSVTIFDNGGGNQLYSNNRRLSDVNEFEYLALTDGETTGTVTTIQIRDGKLISLQDNVELIIYNPQNGDYETIVLNGAWDGETDITCDSITLTYTYPDGSLLQVKTDQQIDIINNLAATTGGYSTIFKSSDDTINSDSTLSNDSDIVFELAVNSLYIIECHLLIDSDPTADFKYRFTIPSGATITLSNDLDGNPSSTFSTGTQNFSTTGGVVESIFLKGTVETAGTGGNLQLQWAQNSSSANNTILKKGSYLILKKLI